MEEKFRREVIIRPAFDKRHKDPSKNYGVHGCDLCMYLHGPKATIQFIVYTHWHLPHVQEELIPKSVHYYPDGECFSTLTPIPADLGYHADESQYEEHQKYDCTLRPQGFCYYAGSGCAASGVWNTLVTKGSEGVWEELEEYYIDRFERKED